VSSRRLVAAGTHLASARAKWYSLSIRREESERDQAQSGARAANDGGTGRAVGFPPRYFGLDANAWGRLVSPCWARCLTAVMPANPIVIGTRP